MCEVGPLHSKMHFSGILLFKEIYRTIAQDKLPERHPSVLIKKPKIKVFEVFEKKMHCTKCVHFGAITIALQDVLVCIWDLGQICVGLFHHFQVFATIMYTGVLFSSSLLA